MFRIASAFRDRLAGDGLAQIFTAERTAAIGALLLGVLILYGVGFAHADILHNAAHDGRHAFAFPCH